MGLKINFVMGCLLLVVFQFSCKPVIENKQDLANYIADEENGLSIVTHSNGMDIKASFLPWQSQAYDKKLEKLNVKPTIAEAIKNNYSFVLSLSKNNKEILRQLPFSRYSEMLQILAFHMSDYIVTISDKGKRIEPIQCLFQQTYGMSRANELLVIFAKQELMQTEQFKIRIKEFGLGTGDLSFDFKTKNLLKLENIDL